MKKPVKLKSKIHFYTAVVFFLLLAAMNASIYFVSHHLLVSSELTRAEEEALQIGKSLLDVLNRGNVPLDNLLRAHVPVDGMIRLVSGQPDRELPSVASGSVSRLGITPAEFYPGEQSEVIAFEGTRYVFVSHPLIWTDGSVMNLQTTQSMAAVDDMLAVLRIVLVSITLLAMIRVFLTSQFLGNFIARPIQSMIQTMQDIQRSGRLKRIKLEAKSGDELVVMGRTFNHMMDLLQENMERQEQFVSNASHELKTPLTVIESYAHLLKRRGREHPELFQESVDAIHSEAVRMKEMTEQLLLLAKNPEHWNIDNQPVHLTSFAHELATIYKNAYNRTVHVHIREEIEVETDEQKLKQSSERSASRPESCWFWQSGCCLHRPSLWRKKRPGASCLRSMPEKSSASAKPTAPTSSSWLPMPAFTVLKFVQTTAKSAPYRNWPATIRIRIGWNPILPCRIRRQQNSMPRMGRSTGNRPIPSRARQPNQRRHRTRPASRQPITRPIRPRNRFPMERNRNNNRPNNRTMNQESKLANSQIMDRINNPSHNRPSRFRNRLLLLQTSRTRPAIPGINRIWR